MPKIYFNVYQKRARLFNISFFSPKAMKIAREDWQFIRMLKQRNDIIHLPNQHLGRYGVFLKLPYIITVHDLTRYFDLKGYATFIHRPNFRDKRYLSLDYRGVKKAARVIAVSQTTKQYLVQHLRIPGQYISVVYEGIDHQVFQPVKHRLFDFPYLLFVGSEHPQKNFAGLLEAFSRLKREGKFEKLKLVKVGKAGGSEAEFRKQSLEIIGKLRLREEVIFTDYVAQEDLPAYYSAAECLILPSFYEGFGFPPLEAMACGCPVIISNRPSLPEIAGEAAMQVDPNNIGEIAATLYEVLANRELRKTLINKGLQRSAEFTWKRTAEQTLQVYHEVEENLLMGRGLYKTTELMGILPLYEY
jgi:glycosyltransferase involved in cell wall biosynthesis